MQKKIQYPIMEINLNHLYENAKNIIDRCAKFGISVSGVVKGTDSYEHSYNMISNTLLDAGCISIADSRMNTIIRMRDRGFEGRLVLLRVPMLSELDVVVQYANCSLQSSLIVLEKTNETAMKYNVIHDVILMMDLGDLREGFFDENELIDVAITVEKKMKNLHLKGIGTNLGCYGSIRPDTSNLGRLVSIAEKIESNINRKLEIISGGATSSLPLVLDGTIPKRINHLRIGEGIALGRDLIDIWNIDMPFMHTDVYTISAEVIEVREKPSYPVGTIFVDAFGNKPEYIDKGIRKKALLAIGKRDVGSVDSLIVKLENAEIIGGSSDHLILDIQNVKKDIKEGDIVSFDVYYGAMVFANNSSSVTKIYKKE
jgi:amino acid racemase